MSGHSSVQELGSPAQAGIFPKKTIDFQNFLGFPRAGGDSPYGITVGQGLPAQAGITPVSMDC